MNISNKLLDYAIVYDDRGQVNSGKYEDKKSLSRRLKTDLRLKWKTGQIRE